MNENKVNIYKAVCIAATVLIAASVFFPFIGLSVFNSDLGLALIKLPDVYGIFIIAVCALVYTTIGAFSYAGIMGAVAGFECLYESERIYKAIGSLKPSLAGSLMGFQSGFYFLVLGTVILVIFSVIAGYEVKALKGQEKN